MRSLTQRYADSQDLDNFFDEQFFYLHCNRMSFPYGE